VRWISDFKWTVLYRMGHEKVARLPFAFAFGYCINFCIYAMQRTRATFSWPTLSSPGPKHSINTEINTVAKYKRKAGYIFVDHSVYTNIVDCMRTQFRPAPGLPESNYCLRRRASNCNILCHESQYTWLYSGILVRL
jgi:hypothetical protein